MDGPNQRTEMPGLAEPTIYDIAKAAGVAPSTVSRALSKPGRVSFKTAERVRRVAAELGYRSQKLERPVSERNTRMLAILVADIANPVFFGMIRGAERAATAHDFTMLVVETQESEPTERAAIDRLVPLVDGVMLGASRLPDQWIRQVAKRTATVLINRVVAEVPSVHADNVQAIARATEHLVGYGHRSICYLGGPEASWADGMRWRGLREAGPEFDLQIRRLGPFPPTIRGGEAAADEWLRQGGVRLSSGVIAYNDLMAIGFIRGVSAAGGSVPTDVSVIGFDNIVDAVLVEPQLTTIAAPLVSLGSAAVSYLLRNRDRDADPGSDPVSLPARLVVRGSTGPSPA